MTDEQIRLENEALNKRTLQALGWRWEPLPGKNAGGELITPAGTRYQFALNELAAWSVVAPQVVSDPCAALDMLSGHVWNCLHSPHDWGSWYVITLRAGEFEGKANTFPRAACKAICAMLEATVTES